MIAESGQLTIRELFPALRDGRNPPAFRGTLARQPAAGILGADARAGGVADPPLDARLGARIDRTAAALRRGRVNGPHEPPAPGRVDEFSHAGQVVPGFTATSQVGATLMCRRARRPAAVGCTGAACGEGGVAQFVPTIGYRGKAPPERSRLEHQPTPPQCVGQCRSGASRGVSRIDVPDGPVAARGVGKGSARQGRGASEGRRYSVPTLQIPCCPWPAASGCLRFADGSGDPFATVSAALWLGPTDRARSGRAAHTEQTARRSLEHRAVRVPTGRA